MNKGVLLLQAPYWSWCADPRNLAGCSSFWSTLLQAWHALENWRKQARNASAYPESELTPAQEYYLSNMQMQVELAHRLEQDQHQLPQPIAYYKVEATGEKRYARDIYTFLLHGSPEINEKNMLRISGERDLQARVLSYKGKQLTLKFERAIDLDRIPASGTFEPIVSGAIYRTQQEALTTLREGEAKNPYLLQVLADHRFQHNIPSPLLPERPLNPAQQEAFQRSLSLNDVLLIWGPPGTGKTRTIIEIAKQYSKQGKRVLITSGTHKAVDNVLEQFLHEKSLTVVRFGHEDRILESVRAHLTIEEQTKAMTQQILERTQPLVSKLHRLKQEIHGLRTQLAQTQAQLTQWLNTQQRQQELRQLLAQTKQAIEYPYQAHLKVLASRRQTLEAQHQRERHNQASWQEKQQRAMLHAQDPLLGFFYRWRVNLFQKRLSNLAPQMAETWRIYTMTLQEQQTTHQQAQTALDTDPKYRQYTANLANVSDQEKHLRQQVQNGLSLIPQQAQGLVPSLAGPTTVSALQHYLAQIPDQLDILEQRATLLDHWRQELETGSEQLTPEVLRYADIVGATCIGVATAKGLADIDFDLVIVDEAGQIGTPDLLVPLVRARRAVLVGDHKQLPPFVDSSVKAWLDHLSPQALQELDLEDELIDGEELLATFTHSAFEQLLDTQPRRDNLVAFTEQRRMPKVIAEFASQHFYNRQLTTVHEPQAHTRTALFNSAFALVDTSTLAFETRKEHKRTQTEDWGNSGYINQCEARLIARLAAHYEQQKDEWVVIVPYRAQASLIISLLEKQIEAPDFRWEERIATVDSFQGGERNYVIYGFTRSNTYGSVGFLSELRRFNVAITRAKQQIVIIGDLSTLTKARDAAFCSLMQHLQDYASQQGELLTYEECQRRLR
jgi:DNA polymerase III delta prime subunit